MRDLPPLTALRAFEAAARHLNVSRAAEDLNVTHAAVSQQIRHLEEWFGMRLFDREGRSIYLTGAGRDLARDLTRAFDLMEEASIRTLGREARKPIKMSTTVVFASRWLMPRLGHFHELHPDLRIALDSTTTLVDYERENVDIGVRYGQGKWPGMEASMLVKGERVPMCSPKLLEKHGPIESDEDLLRLPLIHDVDRSEWEQWFRLQGREDVDLDQGMVHTMSMLAYQAAMEGHGVFLGVEEMAQEDLAAGRLVMPLGNTLNTDTGYYLVTVKGKRLRAPVRIFHDWLVDLARSEAEKA